MSATTTEHVVEIDDLVRQFPVRGDGLFRKAMLAAVNHVSLTVAGARLWGWSVSRARASPRSRTSSPVS